ncbi:MAG: DNA polymerase III subunit gamma/tau C-terminal domain-containing protein, partial [Pseudomonadota bacterium]
RITDFAKRITAEDAQLFYQIAINGKRDMALASDPRSGFEMALLRMVAFRPAAVLDESLEPDDLVPVAPPEEQVVAQGVDAPTKKQPRAAQAPAEPDAEPEPQAQETLSNAEVDAQADIRHKPEPMAVQNEERDASTSLCSLSNGNWSHVLEQLGLTGIVYTIANNCAVARCEDDTLSLVLDTDNAALFNAGHTQQIGDALERYFDTKLSLQIEPGDLPSESPAQRQLRLAKERQQTAEAVLEADPVLQKLISRFDGELDRSSITPVDS